MSTPQAPRADVLSRQITYSGEGFSVRSLEETIGSERTLQNTKVDELRVLRERNAKLQDSLAKEVRKLRKLSDYVQFGKLSRQSFWTNVKEVLSYIPGLRRLAITRRSVEELLRQQYEISSIRVKEAAEFADRLESGEQDLYDEIERLNRRIIEAARNEEVAADYVLELNAHLQQLEAEAAAFTGDRTAGLRETQAQIDEARRTLALHSSQLRLFHTAEERLAGLRDSTRRLVETIANLRTDILQYVQAAGEKLDMVSGQIRALGMAADASVVMLELKRSLDAMTESINQTTRFVSETQLFFRQNLDSLVDDLKVYDDETREMLDRNLEASRQLEQARIREAVEVALARRAQRDGAPAVAPVAG